MQEDAALTVLLVQAVEQADPDGHVFTRAERAQASRDARDAGGDPTAGLVRRAEALARLLPARAPALPAALHLPRTPARAAPWLILAAGLAGLLGNALGPQRHINILSFPLLGVLAWNLAVYGAMVVSVSRPWRRAPGPVGATEPAFRGLWARGLAWAAGSPERWGAAARGDTAAVVRAAGAAFARAWRRTAGPLWRARVELLLHGGAVALAAGLVLGMYLRGLAFQYEATWESTFLGPRSTHVLLTAVLGPAAALLGQPVPGPEVLAAIRAPGSGDAAPWIHLYAATAAIVVLAPRAALALLAARRARRLAADLPVDLDGPYFRRLLSAHRGETARIDAIPYSCRLEPQGADALAAALGDLVGPHAAVRLHPPADYGTEAEAVLARAGAPPGDGAEPTEAWLAVVFSLAQPPEPEVHGELMDRLRAWAAREPGGRHLVVLVEGSGYRRRLAGGEAGPGRLAERRRAWDRVTERAGLAAVHLDLDGGAAAGIVARLEAGAWPVPAPGNRRP